MINDISENYLTVSAIQNTSGSFIADPRIEIRVLASPGRLLDSLVHEKYLILGKNTNSKLNL